MKNKGSKKHNNGKSKKKKAVAKKIQVAVPTSEELPAPVPVKAECQPPSSMSEDEATSSSSNSQRDDSGIVDAGGDSFESPVKDQKKKSCVVDPQDLKLNTDWAMFYQQRSKHPEDDIFDDSQNYKLCEVRTVAEFWRLMSIGGQVPDSSTVLWMSVPMKLPYKRTPTLSFFRAGIKPEWEDEGNLYGAEWRLELTANRNYLNVFWLKSLLAAVGENIGPAEISRHVTGILVQRRNKADRIKLWTNGVADPEANKKLQQRIVEEWFKVMDIATKHDNPNLISLQYTLHSTAISNESDRPPSNARISQKSRSIPSYPKNSRLQASVGGFSKQESVQSSCQ